MSREKMERLWQTRRVRSKQERGNKGDRFNNFGNEVKVDVFLFIWSQYSNPTNPMLGVSRDNAYVIFTVALVNLRILHFHPSSSSFHASNQAIFTWFSSGVSKEN